MDTKYVAFGVSAALLICILACGGAQNTGSTEIMAQGEAFRNLTIITEQTFPAAEPDVGPAGEVIFASKKDGNWDLYMKRNPTAKAVQQLTTHGAADRQPAISPDGTQVAFASNRSGNYDIFIARTNGGTAKRQVTDSNEDEYLPAFSPDGNLVAYTRFSRVDGRPYIWTKDLNTGANVQLGPGMNPQFSPDGSTILFQKASQAGDKWFGVWSMDIHGSSLTQLVASTDWGAIQASWSPDGQKIIFTTSKGVSSQMLALRTTTAEGNVEDTTVASDSGNNIWIVNADGSNLTQLTTHRADDMWPHWSKDNFVYFESYRDGKQKIWRFVPVLPDGYVPAAPAAAEPAPEATPEANPQDKPADKPAAAPAATPEAAPASAPQ